MTTLFKYMPKAEYKAKVTILVPGDFDAIERCEFTMLCKQYSQPELKERITRLTSVDDESDSGAEVLRDFIRGWEGLPGADGSEVPFTREHLEEALKVPCYRRGFIQLFFDQVKGPQEPARKNSKR